MFRDTFRGSTFYDLDTEPLKLPGESMTMRSWRSQCGQCASRVGNGLRSEPLVEPLRPRRQHLACCAGGRTDAPPALLLAGVHSGDFEAVACPLLIKEARDNLESPIFARS